MSAKGSRNNHFVDILIFVLLIVGATIIFFAAIGYAQNNDVILTAPGQLITDSISLTDNCISITLPTFDTLNLDPRNSPCIFKSKTPLSVHTCSGCNWILVVSATNGGFLSEYDGTTYPTVGSKLLNPMRISLDGTSFVDLSTGGILRPETNPTDPTDVYLSQDVSCSDRPLHNGHVYRLEISFIFSEACQT